MDLCLSVLADCSLQLEEIRLLIKENNGIQIIVNILKSQHKSVLNRAARALGNISLSHDNITTVHKYAAGPLLIKVLKDSNDPGTQESLTRTIRLISNNSKHRDLIVKAEGLRPIVQHLNSEVVSVCSQCVRAIAELTKTCSPAAAIQVLEEGGITTLVQLTSHNKSIVKEHAFTSLINLMRHSTVRASVGSANGVFIFLQGIQNPTEKVFSLHLHALCLCCQEAVNRAKLKEINGLIMLINILKANEHVIHHERIILALECFYFDEDVLELFGNSGLIQILVNKLTSLEMISDLNDTIDNESEVHLEECCSQSTSANISSGESKNSNKRIHSKVTSMFDLDEDIDEKHLKEKVQSLSDSNTSEFDQFIRKPQLYSPISVDLSPFLRNQEQHHPSSLSPSSDACYSPCFSMSPPSYEFSPTTSPQLSPGASDCLSSTSATFNSEECHTDDHILTRESLSEGCAKTTQDTQSSVEVSSPNSNFKRKCRQQAFSLKARKHEFNEPINNENKSYAHSDLISEPTTSQTVTRLKSREHGILLLLSRFSYKNELCKFLLTVDCFDAFIKVIVTSKSAKCVAKCSRLMVRLLHNVHCLEDLIMLSIPTLINQKLTNEKKRWPACEIVEHLFQLGLQIETVFGEKLIENMITSTVETRRFACCKVIPFFCRLPQTRKKLLQDMNAISLYREFLQISKGDEIFNESVHSLRQLAHTVGIKDPVRIYRKKIEKQQKQSADYCCKYDNSISDVDTEFILDDKSKIPVNRNILSEKSDVFAAMLSGDFIESHQNLVPLTEVSQDTMKFIIHKLYGCSHCCVVSLFGNAECSTQNSSESEGRKLSFGETTANTTLVGCDKDVSSNVKVCIEAMVVSDRFLLHDIQKQVYDILVSKVLNERTAPFLYTCSKQFERCKLGKACLEHILCGDDVNPQSFKTFLQSTISAIDHMILLILEKSS
ncbi:armadillo repeat-containing protein 5-like [Antedon mediterranea]|uniref:armadillo repeat-containing protein 5-like n=1 Tax=Antedon mediterranea TaxID=105859 RepID=UPI003AF784EC